MSTNQTPKKGTTTSKTTKPRASTPKPKKETQAPKMSVEEIQKLNSKIKEENTNLKRERAQALRERDYLPKPGTGKMFHVEIEQPQFRQGSGRKVSRPVIQIMEYGVFAHWLESAARLGQAFRLKHFPYMFLNTSQQRSLTRLAIRYFLGLSNDLFEFNEEFNVDHEKILSASQIEVFRNPEMYKKISVEGQKFNWDALVSKVLKS